MIIKKFNLFLEKEILTKSSNSGSTKQNDIILDEPSNNKSLSSLLLLNDKLKKKEIISLIKRIKLNVSRDFIKKLLYSNYSNNHIERIIIYMNNTQFIKNCIKKYGKLDCEYCGKENLITREHSLDKIISLKIPISNNKNLATTDHKQPKAKGGDLYDYNNLAVCCLNCNGIKGDMSYGEWKYLMDISNKLINDLDLNHFNYDLIKKSELFNSIESSDFKKSVREFIKNKVNN